MGGNAIAADNNCAQPSGIDMLFSVGDDTLTFNSTLSGATSAPILRREVLPAEGALDRSKARGQYFSMKQQHLTEVLDLTEDQLATLKPILEQETAEAGQFLWNPAPSRKDKLQRFEKLVRSSDAHIKPFLSPAQEQKLLDLRKKQKQNLKKLIAEHKADKHD